jgi:hypothetical protein
MPCRTWQYRRGCRGPGGRLRVYPSLREGPPWPRYGWPCTEITIIVFTSHAITHNNPAPFTRPSVATLHITKNNLLKALLVLFLFLVLSTSLA